MGAYITSLKIRNGWGYINQEIPELMSENEARMLEIMRHPVAVPYEISSKGEGLLPLELVQIESKQFVNVLYGSNGKGKTTILESVRAIGDLLDALITSKLGDTVVLDSNCLVKNMIQYVDNLYEKISESGLNPRIVHMPDDDTIFEFELSGIFCDEESTSTFTIRIDRIDMTCFISDEEAKEKAWLLNKGNKQSVELGEYGFGLAMDLKEIGGRVVWDSRGTEVMIVDEDAYINDGIEDGGYLLPFTVRILDSGGYELLRLSDEYFQWVKTDGGERRYIDDEDDFLERELLEEYCLYDPHNWHLLGYRKFHPYAIMVGDESEQLDGSAYLWGNLADWLKCNFVSHSEQNFQPSKRLLSKNLRKGRISRPPFIALPSDIRKNWTDWMFSTFRTLTEFPWIDVHLADLAQLFSPLATTNDPLELRMLSCRLYALLNGKEREGLEKEIARLQGEIDDEDDDLMHWEGITKMLTDIWVDIIPRKRREKEQQIFTELIKNYTGIDVRINNRDISFIKNEKSSTIEQLSSGEKRIIKLIHEILFPDNEGPILIDEPEISLHPAWMIALRDIIERTVAESRRQIILCTHSPEIIAQFDERAFPIEGHFDV